MKTPLLLVELATADVPGGPILGDDSWICSSGSTYHDLSAYCVIPPDATKSPSLGVICENVLPQEGNSFDLELGVSLPDLFPNLNGVPEYVLQVFLADRGIKNLCFSNVMARLRFEKDGNPFHALMPRWAVPQVRAGEIQFIPQNASVELLRTFATSRYVIQGTTAEGALESHLDESLHDFLDRLNHVLKAIPFADPSGGLIYLGAYSPVAFDSFYFMLRGAADTTGHGRVAFHAGRTILRPPNLPAEGENSLRRYLDGTTPLDDIKALLHTARVFLDGGVAEYVLLLSVIAAEVATQRFVRKNLLAAGVSKKRLDELEKDLPYSVMLNVLLYAVTPKEKKPDTALLGKMNRARRLRNDYMHNGLLPPEKQEIAEIYHSTKKYVEYLRETESCLMEVDFANKRGTACVRRGDFEKVIADCTEAIRLKPDFAEAYDSRGAAYGRKGDHDRAIADCTQAIRLKPDLAEAYDNRGVAYANNGDFDKAIADCTEAIRLKPGFAEAYGNRSVAYGKMGDFAKAITDCTEAITLDPQNPFLHNGLAWLLATCAEEHFRDGKRAVQHATQACELTQWQDSNYIDTLSAAYAEGGEFDKAVEFQQKALEMATVGVEKDALQERLELYMGGKPYREAKGK